MEYIFYSDIDVSSIRADSILSSIYNIVDLYSKR